MITGRRKLWERIRADQRVALVAYAARAGDDWKASLRADWMRAGSRLVDVGTYTLLHQLRNSHGPRWLKGFRLT